MSTTGLPTKKTDIPSSESHDTQEEEIIVRSLQERPSSSSPPCVKESQESSVSHRSRSARKRTVVRKAAPRRTSPTKDEEENDSSVHALLSALSLVINDFQRKSQRSRSKGSTRSRGTSRSYVEEVEKDDDETQSEISNESESEEMEVMFSGENSEGIEDDEDMGEDEVFAEVQEPRYRKRVDQARGSRAKGGKSVSHVRTSVGGPRPPVRTGQEDNALGSQPLDRLVEVVNTVLVRLESMEQRLASVEERLQEPFVPVEEQQLPRDNDTLQIEQTETPFWEHSDMMDTGSSNLRRFPRQALRDSMESYECNIEKVGRFTKQGYSSKTPFRVFENLVHHSQGKKLEGSFLFPLARTYPNVTQGPMVWLTNFTGYVLDLVSTTVECEKQFELVEDKWAILRYMCPMLVGMCDRVVEAIDGANHRMYNWENNMRDVLSNGMYVKEGQASGRDNSTYQKSYEKKADSSDKKYYQNKSSSSSSRSYHKKQAAKTDSADESRGKRSPKKGSSPPP